VGLGLVSYGSNNSRCDAGTTTVTVTGAATTNYQMAEDTADIIIARRGEDNGAVFAYTLTHGGVETVDNIYPYTGSAIAPTLVIQDTSLVVGEGSSATYYTLVEGTDYTIDAGSDMEKTLAGTGYTIQITFIGNFKGTGSVTWSIQDGADPVITTELADDGIYCGAKNFTVTDPNLLSVLVEQKVEDQYEAFLFEEVGSSALPTGTTSKEYTLEGSSAGTIYRITATDVSGNQTILQNITIYDAHSFTNYENLDATQQNLVVATCDHNCGATDTKERFWGRVNWNYEYSYSTTDPAHPMEQGVQGVEARSTRACVELVQTDVSQQTKVLATQMVSCEDRCGSSATNPANTGSEDFTFAYYDPQDPTKNPTSFSSGILRIPSQDEDGNPYTYAVKVTTLSATGEAVSDYTIDYARDYASTPAPAAGDTVSITYQPNCFTLPWKVVITDLSSTEGVTVVPDGIYVKVLYSLPGEDQWSQDASYQIISQQADPTNLGVYCEKVEQQDGTYAYTGSYPVWQYVGGTTESYYHRIQVVSYVYQGHTYDVSGKNYRSIADADHVNHTVYYTGEDASGTILYELPEESKNTASEEFSMPVLIFDYNEGNDTTNLATPKTVEKIVKTDYTSEVTESEISSVTPSRENYSFLGWFSAAEEGEKVTSISPLSKTTTIYAHWRELVPPTGSIQVDTNAWNSFLHSITFGQFYANTMEVTITAEDTAGTVENSGVASIQYLLTDTGMDETEITSDQLTWTDYTGSFTIDPNAAYIIYAKISDRAGNVCYISSDGMILDDVAPVVTGVTDGATYCGEDVVIEGISDLYLSEAILDGSLLDLSGLPVTVTVDRTLAADVAQTHTLVTKDHAGNTTTITFTQYSDHLYRKDPVFTWSEDYETATATFVCEYQEDHTKTLDCTITKEQTKWETLVTATVTLDGKTYQDTKTIIDPEVLDGDTLIRLIIKVEDGVEEIPETLEETDFSTEEAILQEMLRVTMETSETYEDCDYELYDVELQISYDNGTTWALVTEEDFPEEGITITLPYPEGVDPESHEFMVTHMFTQNFHGHTPGEVETPEVHKKQKGLEFVVTSLSPVMIAWRDTIVAESIDVSPKYTTLEGIGTTADLQEVITPVHADHAKVTWSSSDPSIATVDENGIVTSVAEGTVTITVTCADGKLSATAQVTVVLRKDDSEDPTDGTSVDENNREDDAEEDDESSIGSSAIPKTADPLSRGTLLGLLGMMMSSLAVFGWLFLDEKKKRMR
nr:Ig-like domain-containing protein [Lachnospiraceae bacterium]